MRSRIRIGIKSEELGPGLHHMKSRIRIRNIVTVMRIRNTVQFLCCFSLFPAPILQLFLLLFCAVIVLFFYCSCCSLLPFFSCSFYPLLILLPPIVCAYIRVTVAVYKYYLDILYIVGPASCVHIHIQRGSCLTARINYPVMTPPNQIYIINPGQLSSRNINSNNIKPPDTMSSREGIGRVPFALSKYYCQIRREILSNLYLPGNIFLLLLPISEL